jgi:hypothetical protein
MLNCPNASRSTSFSISQSEFSIQHFQHESLRDRKGEKRRERGTACLIIELEAAGMPVGLLMNFNVPLLKQGTHRIVRPDLLMRTE